MPGFTLTGPRRAKRSGTTKGEEHVDIEYNKEYRCEAGFRIRRPFMVIVQVQQKCVAILMVTLDSD